MAFLTNKSMLNFWLQLKKEQVYGFLTNRISIIARHEGPKEFLLLQNSTAFARQNRNYVHCNIKSVFIKNLSDNIFCILRLQMTLWHSVNRK